MPSIPPRGVRKVSELVAQKGRAFILSEEDADKLRWSDIPVSTLKINPKTGIMSVKLEGESDWVPAGIKNDGTLSISKDGKITIENFTVKNVDFAKKTFSYAIKTGDIRNSIIDDKHGFIFNLEEGSYQPKRNQIEAVIDDILIRSHASGGLSEISENSFGIKDSLLIGQEITVKYNCAIRIGNPYPRFFLNSDEPDAKLAETGDFWLDYDATMNQEMQIDPEADPNEILRRVNWSDIIGKPDTIYGYGIKDQVSYEGHTHKKSDITDFPTSMRANGGNADTVNGFTADANKPGTMAILDLNGKIPLPVLPQHRHSINDVEGLRQELDLSLSKIMDKLKEIGIGIVASSLKENGWIKFANGLIIQWMYCIESSSETDYRYFPTKFPKSVFYISANSNYVTSWGGASWTRNVDTEKFICGLGTDYNSANQTAKMFVIAFGI